VLWKKDSLKPALLTASPAVAIVFSQLSEKKEILNGVRFAVNKTKKNEGVDFTNILRAASMRPDPKV